MSGLENTEIGELDVVALLADEPELKLRRGQVGTVVELLDVNHVLVEFTEPDGAAFAVEPLLVSHLLPLVYNRRAA